MPDTSPQENQQELFQEFSSGPKKVERLPSLNKTQKPILLTTNIEQLLLLGILLILLCCAVFFLGMLRGMSLGNKESRPPAAQRVRATAPAPSQLKTQPPAASVTGGAPQPPLAARTNASLAQQDMSKPYTLQLVTHKKKDLAEQEMMALRRGGFFSWIIPSGEYYQVCVGQYLNKDDASKDLRAFSRKYKDCFLRRR